MSDEKISALSSAAALDGTEYTVVVQSGADVKQAFPANVGTGVANVTTSHTTPLVLDATKSITYITSDGSGLAQSVYLPALLNDANGNNLPGQGARRTITLAVQANAGDSVLVFPTSDDAGATPVTPTVLDAANNTIAAATAGVLLDYVGATADFVWIDFKWVWDNTVYNNDSTYTTNASAAVQTQITNLQSEVTALQGLISQDGSLNLSTGGPNFGHLTTGANNYAFGDSNLTAVTTGGDNIAIGEDVLNTCTTGNENLGIGSRALTALTTASHNIAIGDSALRACTTGADNTAIGGNSTGATTAPLAKVTTGSSNTAVGDSSSANVVAGNNNTAIGRLSGPASDLTNTVSVGYQAAAAASNTVQIGNSSVLCYNVGAPVLVSALPSAATVGAGARAMVTDATVTTFASTVAGSGGNTVPVYSDGTNWKIG